MTSEQRTPWRGWSLPGRWRSHRLIVGPQGVHDASDGALLAADWTQWCAGHPGARVSIWMAGEWLVECPPAADNLTEPDLLEQARLALSSTYGDSPTDWVVARWHSGVYQGVTAISASRWRWLQDTAAHHRVRLIGTAPGWARALARLKAMPGSADRWVINDWGRLTLLQLDCQALAAISTDWLAADDAQHRGEWMSRQGHPMPRWLGPGTVSGSGRSVRVSAPQFLGKATVAGQAVWAWLLAGTCVLSAALSVEAAFDRWQALEELSVSSPAAPVHTATAASEPVDSVRARVQEHGQSMAQRLNHPWATLFVGSERAAKAGWQWLSLDHDAETGEIHGEAQQPDDTAVFKLPVVLQQAGWQAPLVRSLQPAGANLPGHRVSIDAQLGAHATKAGADIRHAGEDRR